MHDDQVMDFGKHKGVKLRDIPVEYLDWLISQEWLYDDVTERIIAHLKTRPEWQRMDDE